MILIFGNKDFFHIFPYFLGWEESARALKYPMFFCKSVRSHVNGSLLDFVLT